MGGVSANTAEGRPTRDKVMGVASRDSEGLYRVEHHCHRVIWVPAGDDSLEKRLFVCAHLEEAAQRGVRRWLGVIAVRLCRIGR